MKSFLLVLALFASVIQFGVVAHADEPKPQFAVIDWFPFGYVEGGRKKGLFVDVVSEIDKALSSDSDVVIAPITRVFRGLDTGEFDFTFSYRSEAYAKHLDYVLDIGCLRPTVISMVNKPINYVQELNGTRIAYPPVGYFVRRILPTISVDGIVVPNTQVMFKMALRGRLDAFVINEAIWEAFRHDLFPGFKIPKERWTEFHTPLFTEIQRLSLSVSPNSHYQEMAQRIRTLMKNASFVQALQAVFIKHKIPHAMQCLSDTDKLYAAP